MKTIVGHVPKESGFTAKYRRHQGWWRTFVLNLEEGKYFSQKKWKQVCNRINEGEIDPDKKNFLSKDIADEVRRALQHQKSDGTGIMEKDRLYNNLLSSQPLAFNFWGFFRANPDLALAFLQTLRPDITVVEDIVFEYAPKSSQDGSAFDVGFVVRTATQRGFIGFEVKYTDSFSYKRNGTKNKYYYGEKGDRNFEQYYPIFTANPNRFKDGYDTYVRSRGFNQLFRNEILGCLKLQEENIDFVITGLFCHHDDKKTCDAGHLFQKLIGNGKDDFIVMTYLDYIERMQRLDLQWETRELVMLLWARYCGLDLSENIVF